MILSMRMRNIALIEELSLEFGEGLHVMTGETGAGKSIVVDAVNLVLGGRAARELIRTGTDKAWVEAVFDASGNEEVAKWAQAQALDDFDGTVTLYDKSSNGVTLGDGRSLGGGSAVLSTDCMAALSEGEVILNIVINKNRGNVG